MFDSFYIPLMLMAIFLATTLKKPGFKGYVGELIIGQINKWKLDKSKYHIFNNVTIPTDSEGGTTQIDHILISEFGVFVVETKNMKGWIYGKEYQKIWTQKIFKYSGKFQNPLHQNYKHIKTLEEVMGIEIDKLHSVVVFIGDCRLKNVTSENVVTINGYLKLIKSRNRSVLTEDEVSRLCKLVKDKRKSPSLKTSRDHAAHVKTLIDDKAK